MQSQHLATILHQSGLDKAGACQTGLLLEMPLESLFCITKSEFGGQQVRNINTERIQNL